MRFSHKNPQPTNQPTNQVTTHRPRQAITIEAHSPELHGKDSVQSPALRVRRWTAPYQGLPKCIFFLLVPDQQGFKS